MPEDRRLAAIMFTDIVGYTALMGSDEDGAFKLLRKNREIQKPLIKKYRGQWLKEMGDGILASFSTASDAVRCAGEIQRVSKKEGVPLRIGIHEGEVVFEGSDVLGDGVNVASRLEDLADVGCIYISGAVFKDIKNKAGISAEFIEEKTLKNVDEPVKVYKVNYDENEEVSTGNDQSRSIETDNNQLTISKKRKIQVGVIAFLLVIAVVLIWRYGVGTNPPSPQNIGTTEGSQISIAVLPFDNMSGDPEQEYMCDGLTEEIILHLSKINAFEKVISRTSVLMFKETDKPLPEIAEILGVNTILEGSYRQSGDLIRITTQLIDATNDNHIWSDSYDRPMGDIFDIQSDIAKKVALELQVQLSPNEVSDIEKKPTENTEAYNTLMKGNYLFWNNWDFDGAIEYGKQALKIDSTYVDAYVGIGLINIFKGSWMGNTDMQSAAKSALPYIEKALELDPESTTAHLALGSIRYWSEWNFPEAEKELLMGLSNSSSTYNGYINYTQFLLHMGRYDEALDFAERALEIDPINVFSYWNLYWLYSRLNQKQKSHDILKNGNDLLNESVLLIKTGNYFTKEGDYEKAIHYYERYNTWWKAFGFPPRPNVMSRMGLAYYFKGEKQKADSIANELIRLANQSQSGNPDYFITVYYSGIGDIENAFYWLDKAYQNHNVELINLKDQPQFEILKNDTRYWDLYEKVGFKAYDEYREKEGIN